MANWYEGSFSWPANGVGQASAGRDFITGTTYHFSFTISSTDPGTPYSANFGVQRIPSSPLGEAPTANIYKSPNGPIGSYSLSGSFVAGLNANGSDPHYAMATMAMAVGYFGNCSFVINPEGWTGEEPPAPPITDPPEVIITDPDLVAIDTLEEIEEFQIRIELKDVGQGRLVINRYSPGATDAILKQGNWCQVKIPRIDPDAIFIWQLESGTTVLLDAKAEQGGERVTWGGRGGLSYLERVKAWNESFVVPAGKSTTGVYVGPASTGGKAGQLLKRAIDEWQHVNRGVSDFGARLNTLDLMTHDFDYVNDSDGNAWVVTPSTADLSYGTVGENGLFSASKLVATGALDIIMQPNLLLQAFNHYGRDLTSTTFQVGKVRFERGVNIAERMERQVGTELAPTHTLVQGELPAYGYARSPTYASRPTVEGFVETQGTDPAFLQEVGLSDMAQRLRRGESVSFEVDVPMPGNEDELAGLYLPGPDWSANGKYWIGDEITLHTGTETYGDLNNETVRIHAITLFVDKANNLRCTIEVKWTAIIGRQAPTVGAGSISPPTTGGGTTTPPPPGSSTLHGHDHGALSGLGDNDHPQYTTDAEVDAIVAVHTGDTTDAHDASAISVLDTANNFTGTDVEAVLAELVGGGAIADHNHTTTAGDGGDLDGARVGDYLEFTEIAAPSTPASGFGRLYFKSDGRVYSKDDGGNEYGPFDTAGGGAGFPAYGVDWMRYPYRLGLVGGVNGNHVANPLNASDGSFSTLANSTNVVVPQSHDVDLGAARQVSSVRIVYSGSTTRSDDGSLDYSSDHVNWTSAVTWLNDTTTDRLHTFSPITARYWRVHTTQTGNPGVTGVTIAEFRVINAGTDYAQGKTPTFNQTTTNATNATDSNDATSANQSNTTMPQWARVDLTAAQTVYRGRAVFTSIANRPLQLKIQYSTDDSTWNDVSGASTEHLSQLEAVFDFSGVSARYWRFYVTSAPTGGGINWATIEFWGS